MAYLWRAVDREGEVLESHITRTRGKAAALRFTKKALKCHGSPETSPPMVAIFWSASRSAFARCVGDTVISSKRGVTITFITRPRINADSLRRAVVASLAALTRAARI